MPTHMVMPRWKLGHIFILPNAHHTEISPLMLSSCSTADSFVAVMWAFGVTIWWTTPSISLIREMEKLSAKDSLMSALKLLQNRVFASRGSAWTRQLVMSDLPWNYLTCSRSNM